MDKDGFPELVFASPFDERARFEAKARGYLGHATVQLQDGNAYPVAFYTCTRLGQDLEYEASTDRMCVADVGMIVLPEVTFENMTAAIRRLAAEGFFKQLVPIQRTNGQVQTP